MFNNGRCYIWIPTALTFHRLTTATAAIINAVHNTIGRPTVTAGQTNPYYLDLNDLDMGGAPFTRDARDGMAVCGPIDNLSYLAVEYVSLIVAIGGEVEGLQVFFELDDLDQVCPFGDGEETWATWGIAHGNAPATKIGDKWYRASNAGPTGQPLAASAWIGYAAAGGRVLSRAQYLQLMEAINAAQT